MTSKEKALEKEELTKLLEECKDSIIWNGDIDSLFPEEKAQQSGAANSSSAHADEPEEEGVPEAHQSEPSIFRGRPKMKREKQYPDAPAISNVTNWATYFNTPRTEEEIRDKCLSDYNGVCFTYLCEKQKLREEFIPELMALSTGLLNKDNYPRYLEPVMKATLIIAGVEDGDIDFTPLPFASERGQKALLSTLGDRLDWPALRRSQNFSREFRRKFASILDGKARTQGALVDEYLLAHQVIQKK